MITNFNDDSDRDAKRGKGGLRVRACRSFSSYNIEVKPEGMGEHGRGGGIR